jgi:hypothetical protein
VCVIEHVWSEVIVGLLDILVVDNVVKLLLKVRVVLQAFRPVCWVWFCAIIREVFLFLESATDLGIEFLDTFFDCFGLRRLLL